MRSKLITNDFAIINHAFGDRCVQAFNYDIFGKRIELFFEDYYDITSKAQKNRRCIFTIEGWKDDYSIPYDVTRQDEKKSYMDAHMGIFDMIMKMEYKSDFFEITTGNIDGRYATYGMELPQLSLSEVG